MVNTSTGASHVVQTVEQDIEHRPRSTAARVSPIAIQRIFAHVENRTPDRSTVGKGEHRLGTHLGKS